MKKKLKDCTCENIKYCENCPLRCTQCHRQDSSKKFGDIAKELIEILECEIEVKEEN